MTLKVKRTCERAALPKYAHDDDACFDVSVLVDGLENRPFHFMEYGDKLCYDFRGGAENEAVIPPNYSYVFHTGLKFEVERGYAVKLHVRSSTGIKKGLVLSNSTGIIDSGYRGEILVTLTNTTDAPVKVSDLERVAQAEVVEVCHADIVEESELSESERGEGGIGSTGGHSCRNAPKLKLVRMSNYDVEVSGGKCRDFDELDRKYSDGSTYYEAERLVKKCLSSNRYCFGGNYHQDGEFGSFVFAAEDGTEYAWMTSMRDFGAIMAEVWNGLGPKSDERQYDYMDFYIGVAESGTAVPKTPSSETEFLVKMEEQ